MSEYNLARYLVLMLAINVVLGLASAAIESISGEADTLTQFSSSPAAMYTTGYNLSSDLSANASDVELITADSVDEDTGNIFTDAIKSIKVWWNGLETRFGLLTSILKQPYGFLGDIGMPQPIALGFGIIWYGLLSLLVIAFIAGRNT